MIDYSLDNKQAKENELLKEYHLDTVKTFVSANTNDFGRLFWLVTLLVVVLYGGIVPFNYVLTGFLIETTFQNLSNNEAQTAAGYYLSIVFGISCFLIPIFGYIVDKLGRRAYIFCFACLLGLVSFSLFFFIPAIYPLILLSITSSLCSASIWPCISIIVKPDAVVIYT